MWLITRIYNVGGWDVDVKPVHQHPYQTVWGLVVERFVDGSSLKRYSGDDLVMLAIKSRGISLKICSAVDVYAFADESELCFLGRLQFLGNYSS